MALVLGVVVVLGIGSLIVNAIVGAVEKKHDSTLNREDKLIDSADLTIKCRTVEEHHGVLTVGPRCSRTTKSSDLVMELKGVPSGITFVEFPSRGQYYAQCNLLDGTLNGLAGGGDIITKPSVQRAPYYFSYKNISLPRNSCVVSPVVYTKYIEVDIIRGGVE